MSQTVFDWKISMNDVNTVDDTVIICRTQYKGKEGEREIIPKALGTWTTKSLGGTNAGKALVISKCRKVIRVIPTP